METATLFGSRVRADTLTALAATPKPLSAYRVAKAIEAAPIQVLNELKRLRPLVERTEEGWILQDDLLRGFLAKELRAKDRVRRDAKDVLLARLGMKTSIEYGRGRVHRDDR